MFILNVILNENLIILHREARLIFERADEHAISWICLLVSNRLLVDID